MRRQGRLPTRCRRPRSRSRADRAAQRFPHTRRAVGMMPRPSVLFALLEREANTRRKSASLVMAGGGESRMDRRHTMNRCMLAAGMLGVALWANAALANDSA